MKSWWHWLALVVAIVVLINVRATDGASRKKSNKSTPVRVVEKVDVIVDGFGETPEKARQRALENAREQVVDQLNKRLTGTGWAPTPEQLEPRFLAAQGVLVEHSPPEPANIGDEKVLVAKYRVALTTKYLKSIENSARLQSVEERHKILARVLGGILAIVLVIAGYLRLEEWTNGYATKLLRLVAGIFLAVVAATLWITR